MPLGGPSEVRALGRAFNAMGNGLAELVAKEQAARREAEEANRSKDDFLATVSHELRTPLTAILGWSQMLQSERLPPDRMRHGIEVIERSARAQRQLIDDLLDVSRIVSNRLRIVREPVRLADVIDAALDAVRPQAAAKHVEIETLLSESAVVLGDPRRLEQIVWNLAWNAVKFTQDSGRINVTLTCADRQVILTVADTGVGILPRFFPMSSSGSGRPTRGHAANPGWDWDWESSGTLCRCTEGACTLKAWAKGAVRHSSSRCRCTSLRPLSSQPRDLRTQPPARPGTGSTRCASARRRRRRCERAGEGDVGERRCVS